MTTLIFYAIMGTDFERQEVVMILNLYLSILLLGSIGCKMAIHYNRYLKVSEENVIESK